MSNMTKEQQAFIQEIAPYVVADMKKNHVLASLTLAQAILESNWGKSSLSRNGKNLFGIKGSGGDYDTKEFVNGQWITIKAGFRHYDTWAGSIHDHSDMLRRLKRYTLVIGERDYRKACNAIHAAGYATDPTYAGKLISIIEKYELYQFDTIGEGTVSKEPTKFQKEVMETAVKVELFDNTHQALENAPKWWVATLLLRFHYKINELQQKINELEKKVK